ncbi:glycosyltransferase family 2 protein [Sulfitobacter aestuariivivens]|uniref:Glycosyltransferase family 2 protein n=1 Tax=Sulfitobacter aestuariivivens TaxID=2766981 RepID=A0A927HEL6_9RHOB|nr:glycosyltransferase family 2 protein [Sulfitobacter aestuariivivens]MBD3663504.1 glycosyltransferase family 2 protein [Sulfitobacter aestuariivivens]
MKLTLFIGPAEQAAMRLRVMLKDKADRLAKLGVVAPDWNHVRLYAACAAPDAVGVLRYKRGLESPLVQQTLSAEFHARMEKDLPHIKARHVVLSAAQLGSLLHRPAEIERLKGLLSQYFNHINVVAHVSHQTRMMCMQYSSAVMEGRRQTLDQELALARQSDWWSGALAYDAQSAPDFGIFPDVERPPFWLDYVALQRLWEGAFGAGSVTLAPFDLSHLMSDRGTDALFSALGLDQPLGKTKPGRISGEESAATLARMRQFNDVLIAFQKGRDISCPRALWQQMLASLRVPGAPIDPGSLHAVSEHFARDNADLIRQFPALRDVLTAPEKQPEWREADAQFGFRATQYLTAYAHGISKHSTPMADKRAQAQAAEQAARKFDALLTEKTTNTAERAANTNILNKVKVNYQMVLGSQFRPHNNLGAVNEEELSAAFKPAPSRPLQAGSSGNVIVACMKNEGPYIVEWIAYHRAIGVDHFLVYTNDCDDATDAILGRLQELGHVTHRSNEGWKGNSPQQYALNQAIREPVVHQADWIAHIDVDEFINIRTGNGTLSDLFAAVPDATNIAMTWRLFGHNGVTDFRDDFVIEQFDACAPKFCPKPHTVWGYKSMFRNIGAYEKISCHRPNKLSEAFESKVKWVNGSGQDMTRDAARNGWRSSKSNVGYDLVQLNHYALRSAESFLIKRQRGRALHVDRSIGINYWIRMDWSDYRDITIKRNVPRVRDEYDRLMQDDNLRDHHKASVVWHKQKAAELRQMPEFRDLYAQALAVKLTETERVAYALALDMET